MSKTNPLIVYRETQIKTANQGTLIVMLYDEALKHLGRAIESLDSARPNIERTGNHIVKVQDIVTELMVSLDFEKGGSIAKNLFSLYVFVNKQLVDANIRKDITPLAAVKKLLEELRGAWAEVAPGHTDGPMRPDKNGLNIAG